MREIRTFRTQKFSFEIVAENFDIRLGHFSVIAQTLKKIM